MGVQRTYLKELRIKAGLTQQEVADKIGVTKATISKYEKGQRGIKHVNELARLYGVEPMYILTGETTQEWRDKLDREMEMEREYWEKELLTPPAKEVMRILDRLNEAGQQKAVEVLKLLVDMLDTKTPPQDEAQDGEEGGG